MKKFLKYTIITLLSLVGLLGLVIGLAVTVFKEELIEWVIQQKAEEREKLVSYFVAELPVEPSCFAEDFEDIHKQVSDECLLCEQKGIDMDSLYAAFSCRIGKDVKTKSDYGLMVCEYFSALNIGHAHAVTNMFWAGYAPTVVENRIFIDKPTEYIKGFGFCDKDEIVAINHVPIEQYVNNRKKYMPASTEEARMLRTRREVFRSHTDTLIACDVHRNGETLTLELPLTKRPPMEDEPSLASYKIWNDSIGYLCIKSMMGNVVEDFKQSYQKVCKLPYLIVDVRNNGGGNSNNGRLIAEYLVRQPQIHSVGGKITPQADAYQGKLFLLTSRYTFSAAESFTIDLKESGCATLVGEPTAGDTGGAPHDFISKHGVWFRVPTKEFHFSPKGFPMEGMGIEPHVEMKQTVADFLENKDPVVAYVLNELIK